MLNESGELPEDYAVHHKTRDGVKMFFLYAVVYAGFVAINIIKPSLMERVVFMGLNLAVVYGFGLIILALVLAMIYNQTCLSHERKHNTGGEK